MPDTHLSVRRPSFDMDKAPSDPANADVMKIWALLSSYAKDQLLLKRTPEDILEKIRNFRIAEYSGEFAGCVAVRDYGNNFFEIRSLAVEKKFTGAGTGTKLVEGIISDMTKRGGAVKLFALTYRTEFFLRLGFRIVHKDMFPGKIWSDCVACPRRDSCDETAVLLEL